MTDKLVIVTVQGDLHDIGKNLVTIMMERAGFEVSDLGNDVSPEAFVQAVKEHKPDIYRNHVIPHRARRRQNVTATSRKNTSRDSW